MAPDTGRKRKATTSASGSPKRTKTTDVDVPAAGGPGSPMEIVFSFDTTGSMYNCLDEVRKNISDMIRRLQGDIPNLRIAVFAHGDYCDKSTYITKHVDFTTDADKLCDFVNTVERTGGGDWEECYELVLQEVRTKLSWTPGTQRSLVMIGDAPPHPPGHGGNDQKIEWKVETKKLFEQVGLHIYAVGCSKNDEAETFYKDLAKMTEGTYLELSQFSNIFDLLMAICYREHGAEFFHAYENEVRTRGLTINPEMDKAFTALRPVDEPVSPLPSDPVPAPAAPKPKKAAITTESMPPKKIVEKKSKGTKRFQKTTASLSSASKAQLARKWSAWTLAATAEKPVSGSWYKTQGISACLRKTLFSDKKKGTNGVFLYEFSVLPQDSKTHYVVYLGQAAIESIRKYGRSPSLGKILGRSHIRNQLNDVIDQGCKLFVRRCCIDRDPLRRFRIRDDKLLFLQAYDYPWNISYCGRRQHNTVVTTSGCTISDEIY